jgi:hypothetical protein
VQDHAVSRYRFGSKARDALWFRERINAYLAGRGVNPICPHCDAPVLATDPWDRCHVGAPRWAGGKRLQVGHRPCNQAHNAAVDTRREAEMIARLARRNGVSSVPASPGQTTGGLSRDVGEFGRILVAHHVRDVGVAGSNPAMPRRRWDRAGVPRIFLFGRSYSARHRFVRVRDGSCNFWRFTAASRTKVVAMGIDSVDFCSACHAVSQAWANGSRLMN